MSHDPVSICLNQNNEAHPSAASEFGSILQAVVELLIIRH